jgi:hypothetical protein
MTTDEVKERFEECKCGFCVNEKPHHLNVGWRGWFICDKCVERLAEVRAYQDADAREHMIARLTALRETPPVA